MENCHYFVKIQKSCQTTLVGCFLKLRSNTTEFIFQEIGYFEFFKNHCSFDFNQIYQTFVEKLFIEQLWLDAF